MVEPYILFGNVTKSPRDTTYVFYIDLNADLNTEKLLDDDYNFEVLLRRLSLKSQLRVRNIKNKNDRYLKLLNLLFLEFIVACYENNPNDNDQIILSRGKYGKPKLMNRNYGFNLSDEVGVVSMAINFEKNSEIGLDLSDPNTIKGFKISDLKDFYRKDFKEIFTDLEIEKLDKLFRSIVNYDEQLDLLSQYWALKESYSKYEGTGISHGLKQYEFIEFTPILNFKENSNISKTFNVVENNIKLDDLKGLKPKNKCFFLPGKKKMICSLFSETDTFCLVRVDLTSMVNFFKRQ